MAHAQKDDNLYRMMFENMASGFALFDLIPDKTGEVLNLLYVEQNKAHEIQTGLTREQLSGKRLLDVFPGISAEIVSNLGNAALIRDSCSEEFFSRDFGRFFRISGFSPEKNKIAVIFDDITEKKQAELNLKKFQYCIEQSPVSVVITDTWGNIEYVNPKFCEITGYTQGEVTGKNPRFLKSGDTKKQSYTEMWDNLSSGKEWHGEFLNKKKNGELFWESVNISPVKNEYGYINHYIGIKEDITEKKNTEKQLEKAIEKAEEMSKLKSSFLANMSHELRTPMVGILGFSEILGREITDAAHKDMVNSISRSGKRLMETLNLVLDLSRIESDKYELYPKPLNLFKHTEEAVRLFTPVAADKNIELNISASEGGIMSVLDERLFHGIIDNLLNNAVKYTFKGRIDVLISREKTSSGEFAVIYIKDTGIGIAKERIGIIFDEFRQASEGFDRLFEGTGLGLTVTKKYVELLKGTISVKSITGKGSTFIVKFPSCTDSEQTNENPEPQNLIAEKIEEIHSRIAENAKNILVVDDDKSTHSILKIILRGISKIDSAFSGEEALMVAGITQYDIILLDISLGKGLNGYEVLKKIRKIKGCSDIPVVALTAYAMVGDEEKFLRAGFTYYMSKPFERSAFQTAIKKILGLKLK